MNSRLSDTFASPLRGTALDRANSQFDTISACLDSLQTKAQNAFKDISTAIDEVREAVEERRSYVIRGAIPDNTYDLTIIPDNGDFRWCWFTDGSSGVAEASDKRSFAIGGYFGFENPANFAEPADPACNSMFEAEVAAVHRAFIAAKQISTDSHNLNPLSKRITICIDNLESKKLVEVSIKEVHGSLALESLITNNSRIRKMLHEIRTFIEEYTSVEFKWIRSHTTSNSFLARGNEAADRLAKEGLEKAFARIEELQENLTI